MNILKRNSTSINIATFWENYQLGKYEFEPPYQRRSDVWSESQKSFLIDTILKNFPMPPIFLHQHIETSTGKTKYDIIDGKQRFNAIKEFIEGKFKTPSDFYEDGFGDPKLNGINFSDLENKEIEDWKKIFWKYELSIEYIDTDQIEVVQNIFDRLNRNGEPLTNQELRKAKYSESEIYKLIIELADLPFFKPLCDKIKDNRLEHHEFITELLFLQIKKKVLPGDKPEIIDDILREMAKNNDLIIKDIKSDFIRITNILIGFNIDFDKYSLVGVSHIYGLWGFSFILYDNNITNLTGTSNKLDKFYTLLRSKDSNEYVKQYNDSMSAGTKSTARRKRRINALIKYCGFDNLNIEKY